MLVLAQTVFFSGATAALAQQDTQSHPYTIQVNARTVLLDVVVTDKSGTVVPNLNKDDFTIYENGEEQPITSFAWSPAKMPSGKLQVDSTAQLDAIAPTAPVNIIVLDEIDTRFEDEAFARYSLKKFLETQGTVLAPTMLVAVDLNRFMVLRDYTTSRAEILDALEHHLITYPWHMRTGGYQTQQFNAAFTSLIQIVQSSSGHPGHKSILWVGRGFPSINPDNLPPDQALALKTAVERCTNAMLEGRVVLSTIDPAGVAQASPIQDETGFVDEDPLDGAVNFDSLAKTTGGTVFRGRNDVDKLIEASAIRGSEFYTLSYTPSGEPDESKPFRNIRVAMKNPNLHAETRQGYYSSPAPVTESAKKPDGNFSQQLVFDLSVASQGLLVYDGVPFTVVRDSAKPDVFYLRVETARIPWTVDETGQGSTELALVVDSFDRKGKLLQSSAHVSTFKLEMAEGHPKKPMLDVLETISTKEPAARIRFTIRQNATGKIGTQNVFLIEKNLLQDPDTGLKSRPAIPPK